ncbi:MAG: phosphocarrier protein HPr [Candidatus Wallbacteria bacterium HGW-Wallbacteria-1]|jgi:phosphocarrier protein|uniref:Phosphocarrier protein HPr n=1 Tax=Candidatus Wallbacteria bacterium HGW-Wallbacteria-1 TaxID=2013854 RepID=A0A2N1PU81_9BACT|nr:MAG: phosphocarrier protein HPr [Candidatus Wallbacteria bacterium HGW-Wallbacteria-1]
MKSKDVLIQSKTGLHARPAAMFAQCANRFNARVTITKDGMEVDGKSIMGLMLLAAGYNSSITIKADGDDENEALAELSGLVESNFIK